MDKEIKMTLDAAIALLRKIVKYSHLENQKHLDFSLVNSEDLSKYQAAMVKTREAVQHGQLSEEDLQHRLGLV